MKRSAEFLTNGVKEDVVMHTNRTRNILLVLNVLKLKEFKIKLNLWLTAPKGVIEMNCTSSPDRCQYDGIM